MEKLNPMRKNLYEARTEKPKVQLHSAVDAPRGSAPHQSHLKNKEVMYLSAVPGFWMCLSFTFFDSSFFSYGQAALLLLYKGSQNHHRMSHSVNRK